jgi:hypothetical protein
MSSHETDPPRIDEDTTPDESVPGTAAGEPTAGVEADEAEVEDAVEPDDKPFEVDGPEASAGHA